MLAAILIITLFVAAVCGLEVSALVVTLFLDGPRYNRTPRPLTHAAEHAPTATMAWGFLPCCCAIFPMRIAHRKTLTGERAPRPAHSRTS